MHQTIDNTNLTTGAALRRVLSLLEVETLTYDPRRSARLNDVLLGEIETVSHGAHGPDSTLDGVERSDHGLRFFIERPRPGLVAIPVGNRHAPDVLSGGLVDPVTGKPNGEIRGGTIVEDLGGLNLAGFVNFKAEPHDRTKIRVLGTLLSDGRPINLEQHAVRRMSGNRSAYTLVVCGAGTGRGKTTACIDLANRLREDDRRVTYEKKTGAPGVRDSLRVLLGDAKAFGKLNSSVEVSYEDLPLGDFVDAAGTASEISTDVQRFVAQSVAFTRGLIARRAPDVHLIELGHNLSQVTNLALLEKLEPDALVHVPEPSFDAAAHALHYVRDVLGYRGPVFFGGPVATAKKHAALRAEIRERIGTSFVTEMDAMHARRAG